MWDPHNHFWLVVKNVEGILAKKGLWLPSKCPLPLSNRYRPEMDCVGELKAEDIQLYQEIIGQLRWTVDLMSKEGWDKAWIEMMLIYKSVTTCLKRKIDPKTMYTN